MCMCVGMRGLCVHVQVLYYIRVSACTRVLHLCVCMSSCVYVSSNAVTGVIILQIKMEDKLLYRLLPGITWCRF